VITKKALHPDNDFSSKTVIGQNAGNSAVVILLRFMGRSILTKISVDKVLRMRTANAGLT
jgi:hypothetical protein